MCMSVCTSHECSAQRGLKRAPDPRELELEGEPLDMGTENQTQVLCKSNMCS